MLGQRFHLGVRQRAHVRLFTRRRFLLSNTFVHFFMRIFVPVLFDRPALVVGVVELTLGLPLLAGVHRLLVLDGEVDNGPVVVAERVRVVVQVA